jgi:hypothetical protein
MMALEPGRRNLTITASSELGAHGIVNLPYLKFARRAVPWPPDAARHNQFITSNLPLRTGTSARISLCTNAHGPRRARRIQRKHSSGKCKH